MHDAPPRDVLPFKATVSRGGPAPPSTVGLPFLPPAPKTMHGAIAITAGPELGAGALPRTEGIPEKPATLLDAMNGAVLERDAASTTRQSAPAQRIRERSRSPTMLRLLWFDLALPRWIRHDPEWSRLLVEASPPLADEPPPPPDDEHQAAARERSDVLTVVAAAKPTPMRALVKTIELAMGAHGELWPPRVSVAGDLVLRFDPRERAKTWVAATAPLVTHDAALSASLVAARGLLDDSALEGADAIADALVVYVHDILGKAKRVPTASFIEAAVQRALLVQRRYLSVSLLGARWISAKIVPTVEDSPIPVLLPEALGPLLPMQDRFPVRMVADVELSQDPAERAPLLLRVVALAREVPRSSLHQ